MLKWFFQKYFSVYTCLFKDDSMWKTSLPILRSTLFICTNRITATRNSYKTDVRQKYCCQNCAKLEEKWKSGRCTEATRLTIQVDPKGYSMCQEIGR